MAENDQIFAGTVSDFAGGDPLIYRKSLASTGRHNDLRTQRNDLRVLDGMFLTCILSLLSSVRYSVVYSLILFWNFFKISVWKFRNTLNKWLFGIRIVKILLKRGSEDFPYLSPLSILNCDHLQHQTSCHRSLTEITFTSGIEKQRRKRTKGGRRFMRGWLGCAGTTRVGLDRRMTTGRHSSRPDSTALSPATRPPSTSTNFVSLFPFFSVVKKHFISDKYFSNILQKVL